VSDTETSARERLLRAAGVCFAHLGYEATSIRGLTRAARTNLGAITYHFGSKQALYEAVLASRLRPIATTMRRMADQKSEASPLEHLVSILTGIFDLLRTDPDGASLLLQELVSPHAPSVITRQVVREILQHLTCMTAEGQAAGVIRAGSPALLTANALSQPLVFALAQRYAASDCPWYEADSGTIHALVDHMEEYAKAALAS
jgi:AcrR family transcriptional regulator